MASNESYPNNELITPGNEIYARICATYPFYDKSEEETFHEKVSKIETDDPIQQINLLLEALNNPHAVFYKKDDYIAPSEIQKNKLPSATVIENTLVLRIPSLAVESELITDLYDKYAAHSKGLIIDLREGAAGYEKTGRALAERLVKKGDYEFGSNFEIKPEGGLERYPCIFSSRNNNPYEKPIVILVSNKTFSSGERLVASLKNATNAIIIGTATRGGSGNPQESEIIINDDTYVVKIPTWRFVLKGKDRPIEETKIEPDIKYDKTDIVDFAIRHIDELPA